MRFEFKDTIDYKKLTPFLEGGKDVLVGYPEGRPHQGGGPDQDELARTLTYGDDKIPPRPFLEEGIMEQKNELNLLIKTHYEKKVAGGEEKNTLARIGAFCVGAVKEFVFGDYYRRAVPNAPSTIRRKSKKKGGQTLVSDKPLIDTGDMINSTTYVVRKATK